MPSTAANSRVAQRTPAARLPERLVRSSPKRKMTKVVIENSAIAGSDCRVRSSERRSLPRIAAKAAREGVTRLVPAVRVARSRDCRRLADPGPQHLVGLGQEAVGAVGDDDAGAPAAG